MIFAAFFVFFPPFFRSPAGATTVTKCVPARPCETVEEVKGQATGGTYADALTTYRSRLPFFFESPSYLLALDIRSLSALPLNININLGSTRKVLRSLVVRSSSVFTLSRPTVCASVGASTRTHRSECKENGIRRKPLPHTTDVPSVKSIFSPDALFTAPGDKRIFDLGP